jgi:acyl carrier protein
MSLKERQFLAFPREFLETIYKQEMTMELQEFIKKFAEQFDDTELEEFNSDTEFKNLYEWSSMIALSIIAMIDDEYVVTIKADNIRSARTIEDLYNIVKSYKS